MFYTSLFRIKRGETKQMKKMRSVFSAFLILALCFNTICVFGYEFPQSFWEPAKKYEEALNAKDTINIIKYGEELLNIMKFEPDCPEKRQVLASKFKEIALAYIELDRREDAYNYFKLLQSLVNEYPRELESWKTIADNGVDSVKCQIDMYTDKGSTIYYGAKNEKFNGVLYGTNADGKVRTSGLLENRESIVLAYQELGSEILAYNIGVFNNAQKSGYAVELALNCMNEGKDIEQIRKLEWSLREVSEMIENYSDVPVFLRFAAEFDIWERQTDPQSFIDAFRYVSNYFKARNSNVAIVWSPNQVTRSEIDVNDFYPGDEYVDWVGMSSYAVKYFCGNPDQSIIDSLMFRTGDNSNPVTAVKRLVEAYGKRKPIMISEMGVSHYLYNRVNEDTTDFAIQRIKEYYYYLPMIYPQIKAMLYFDHYIQGADNDYRLSTNDELQNIFLNITKGERFIQDKYSNETGFCYRKIYNGEKLDGIFPLFCFAYVNGDEVEQVVYFIDDKYVGMSKDVPYSTYINANNYTGEHVLKVSVTTKSGKTFSSTRTVNINGVPRDVSVEISGKRIVFDQEPVLYNSRTMVPMRKIFESLGATVRWDEETKTVTGIRGDRTVKVTVGSDIMYVNNSKHKLDTPPIVLSDRTLVPIRAIAEGLGCKVEWDNKNFIVEMTPKTFKWSEWETKLPDYVNEDLYYIDEDIQYRYRTREKEYFNLDIFINNSQYVRTDISYGPWCDWQNNQILSMSDKVEVETRVVCTPKKYKYGHYCTGWLADETKRYRTSRNHWCDECIYHELGWFDNPLPYSSDSTSDYAYIVNGEKYRCKNSCFRWYLLETSGGDITQYRSRNIYKEYIYWKWSDWGRWSSWSYEDPYDSFDSPNVLDVEKRTIYRYKEK